MPGKHAPKSSASFFLSLGRWIGAGVVGIGVLVVVLLLLFGGDGEKPKVLASPTAHATPTTSVAASPTISARPHDQVTVAVFNATNRNGLARSIGEALTKEGYDVGRVDNASKTSKSTIYYKPEALADARALLAAHPEFGRIQPIRPTQPKNFLLVIVIGSDYSAS